jgi:uncharacterized membrane protein
MQLSPEEKYKIYEEEKARIEAERKQQKAAGGSTTRLESNIAGMLCYLGGWVTGIIFLVIEQKNQSVRFHALQSIIIFGALTVISAFLNLIPVIGGFLGAVIGILAFILWILLMVKAYQGELYKVPVAGEVAEGILPATWRDQKPETGEEQKTDEHVEADEVTKSSAASEASTAALSQKTDKSGKRAEDSLARARAGRIAGYSASIIWSIVLLIFFSFFYQYIAWYQANPDGSITRLPMLTNDYFIWLPILVTVLVISIAANIIMIIYDKYWFRDIIQIVLLALDVVVVVNLVAIFPFDFSVIPNPVAADIVPVAVTIFLIIIAVGMGVWALVQFIKLIINVTK